MTVTVRVGCPVCSKGTLVDIPCVHSLRVPLHCSGCGRQSFLLVKAIAVDTFCFSVHATSSTQTLSVSGF